MPSSGGAGSWLLESYLPCVGVASGCRLTGSFHWPGLARLRVIRWEEPDLLSLLLKLLMSGTETKVELARSPVCVCVGVCVSTHRSLTKRWRCCFMQITFSKYYHQCHINNVVVSWGQKVFRLKHLQVCVSPTDSSLSGVDLIHFDLIRFSDFFFLPKHFKQMNKCPILMIQ